MIGFIIGVFVGFILGVVIMALMAAATEEYTVSEGDTSDYWEETAANAIRPLHQLIAMAQIRPDGVWEGD